MLAPSEEPSISSPTTAAAEDTSDLATESSSASNESVVEEHHVASVAGVPVETEDSSVATAVDVQYEAFEETKENMKQGENSNEGSIVAGIDAHAKDSGQIDFLEKDKAAADVKVEGDSSPIDEKAEVESEQAELEKNENNESHSVNENSEDKEVNDECEGGGAAVEDVSKGVENVLEDESTVKNDNDDIVRARFVDFEEENPFEESSTLEEREDDDGTLLMGNPELQKIREEQVRKWLIFEQENPTGSVSSLTESMEADSLAAGGSGELTILSGMDTDGHEGAEGNPRRVRFLTDQEGNLLISVFMTNNLNATSQLSDDQPIVSNDGGKNEEVNTEPVMQSPSLVVSPPSLENVSQEIDEHEDLELVDSIEPSAPPMDDVASEDEEEQPSIVLVEPLEPKLPPQEKPPALPREAEDSANESSDETLSVSSCNSMIEIIPSQNTSNASQMITLDEDRQKSESEQIENLDGDGVERKQEVLKNVEIEETAGVATVTPHFQLGEISTIRTEGTVCEENEASSQLPSSLIIHEMEEHTEKGEPLNSELETSRHASPPLKKVPNVDENNNVVDSVLEEEEDGEAEQIVAEIHEPCHTNLPNVIPMPEFKPEFGEQIMPELRRSTSSSDGEEDETLERNNPETRQQQTMQARVEIQNLLSPGTRPPEDDKEAQMVSLCIQEEHISAVALTIAKWESMVSKAQSTENLSVSPAMTGTTVAAVTAHAPVTKSASSPCPKTTSAGVLSSQKPPPVPAKPVHSASSQHGHHPQQQVNRMVVIHGANSPVSTEPLVVTKAAGWSCWGNKAKEAGPTAPTISHQQQEQTGNSSDEIIYAQPNHQAGSTMTSISNPSAILKTYPKPLSKGEIVNWLREGEIHRAGLLLSHHPTSASPVLVSWFFGLISRQQAERYLHGQPTGTFLVRISTRIWGYTLSYQASNGRTKHFLISAINPAVPATLQSAPPSEALPPQSCKQQRMSPFLPQGRYAFIGTNMTPYGTLVSLIRHHSHAPITKLGGEKLLNPCLGGPQVAGLESLFQKSALVAGPITQSAASAQVIIHS